MMKIDINVIVIEASHKTKNIHQLDCHMIIGHHINHIHRGNIDYHTPVYI